MAKIKKQQPTSIDVDTNFFPDYPHYPASQDIYNNDKLLKNVPSNSLGEPAEPKDKPSKSNEKDFNEDVSGDDLDVPGSELDDKQEKIGSEDEENNYYSIGGDNHDDLEEDKGD